jgi:hypothetical protein
MNVIFEENNSSLRQRYIAYNELLDPFMCWSLGYGSGFCADMIGLLKVCIACLSCGLQLRLSMPKNPRGWAIEKGFSDYYQEAFPIMQLGWPEFLNRPINGFSRRRKPLMIAGRLLYGYKHKDSRFSWDKIPADQSDERLSLALGLSGDWWAARREISNKLFNYKWEVAELINDCIGRSDWREDLPWISLHVRRGDKIIEHPYEESQKYLAVLESIPGSREMPIYVFSDNIDLVMPDIKGLGGAKYDFREPGIKFASAFDGYDQTAFNMHSQEERFQSTVRFLAELELMTRANCLIGSSTTNVFCWARYRRGNKSTIDISSTN